MKFHELNSKAQEVAKKNHIRSLARWRRELLEAFIPAELGRRGLANVELEEYPEEADEMRLHGPDFNATIPPSFIFHVASKKGIALREDEIIATRARCSFLNPCTDTMPFICIVQLTPMPEQNGEWLATVLGTEIEKIRKSVGDEAAWEIENQNSDKVICHDLYLNDFDFDSKGEIL
ncbi:MAG: hypothetical protein GX751_03155 [Desulfuromonadaceae bacterium]|nr:hypothetical protein [Desulfuromonadaceae bacterium]